MTPLRLLATAGYIIGLIGLGFAYNDWGTNGLMFALLALAGAIATGIALFFMFAVVALFRPSDRSGLLTRGARNAARVVGISIPMIGICYGFLGAAFLILSTGSEATYVYLPIWLVSSGCVLAGFGATGIAILEKQLSDEALDRKGWLSFDVSSREVDEHPRAGPR